MRSLDAEHATTRRPRPLGYVAGLGLVLVGLSLDPGRLGVQRAEWCLLLPCLQLLGMTAIWRFRDRPRSMTGWVVWVAVNVVLLASAVGLWTGWFDTAVAVTVTVLVKAAVLGLWGYAIAGLPIWLTGISRRRQPLGGSRLPPRSWLAVIGLLAIGELLAGVAPRFSRPELLTFPQSLPDPPPGEIHVCAIGGSTMMGYPYEPKFGIPAVIAWRLQALYPRNKVVMQNLAFGGLNLRQSIRQLEQLTHRPHLLVLYSGHTEYYHELEETVDFSRGPLDRLDPLLDWSPLYRSANRLVSRQPALRKLYPPRGRRLVDRRLVHPLQYQQRLDRFRSQLDQLAEFSRAHDIGSLWYVPAGSESGFEPNRSVTASPPTEGHVVRLRTAYDEGRRHQAAGDWRSAARTYRSALEIEPGFAEFHFQLADCLLQLGQFEQARKHFQQALDHDGQPVRADSGYRRAVTDHAATFTIPVIDTPVVLRPHTRHGILDDTLFHDNVHPTLLGYFLMGRAGADRIRDAKMLERRFGPPADLPPARFESVIDSLEIDQDERQLACQRIAQGLGKLGLLRFDPSGREQQAKLYRLRGSEGE